MFCSFLLPFCSVGRTPPPQVLPFRVKLTKGQSPVASVSLQGASRGQAQERRYLVVDVTRTCAALNPSSGKRLSCFLSPCTTHLPASDAPQSSALIRKGSVALASPECRSPRVQKKVMETGLTGSPCPRFVPGHENIRQAGRGLDPDPAHQATHRHGLPGDCTLSARPLRSPAWFCPAHPPGPPAWPLSCPHLSCNKEGMRWLS